MRKRKAFFTGIVLSLIMLHILSGILWNIEIFGNCRYTDDLILTQLESEGIKCGIQKKLISCEKIEEYLRDANPKISWVSADIDGTRLKIGIREEIETVKKQDKEDILYNIVARKNGRVESVTIRKGRALIYPGDIVTPGQLLIDGHLSVYGDDGNLIREFDVSADGDVIGTGEYHITAVFPKSYKRRVYTGKKRVGFSITDEKRSLVFFPYYIDKKSTVYWKDTIYPVFAKHFRIPLYFAVIHMESYTEYESVYTETERKEMAEKLYYRYCEKILEKGVQIIGNNVKIQCNDSSWEVRLNFTVREELGMREENSTADECN